MNPKSNYDGVATVEMELEAGELWMADASSVPGSLRMLEAQMTFRRARRALTLTTPF